MADKRISEFSEVTSVGSNDVFLVGSTNATNKIKASNLLKLASVNSNGLMNSSDYRKLNIVSIPSNADLNSAEYLVVGIYSATTTAIASTIANTPFKNAFRLSVYTITGSNYTRTQEVTAYDNSIKYYRTCTSDGANWSYSNWMIDAPINADLSVAFKTGAGFHNSIFRGKNLGTSLTSAQSAQITAGTFDDLFVGDYWVINGVTWRIADFDTYYRCGDNISLSHHIVVVPDGNLHTTKWNETNDTSTGYVGSAIRANIKGDNTSTSGAEAKVIAAFGASHVLSYRAIYPTTYSGGKATGWAWTDARVELMNENEVYGAQVWSAEGLGYEVGINKRQLSLFRLSPQFINIRATWWLRSVCSATHACFVISTGDANHTGASTSLGVRPLSLIA